MARGGHLERPPTLAIGLFLIRLHQVPLRGNGGRCPAVARVLPFIAVHLKEMKIRSAFVQGPRDVKVVQNFRETQQNVGDMQGIRASFPFGEGKRFKAFLT